MSTKPKITGVMIDVNKAYAFTYKWDELNDIYDAIGSVNLEIIRRKIGRYNYAILHEKDGLSNNKQISALHQINEDEYDDVLQGNLFIAKINNQQEYVGLNNIEIKEVYKNISHIKTDDQTHIILILQN